MIKFIKDYFRKPTPLEMISQELVAAQLSRLEAETSVDYSKSIVAYNVARITRLETYLKDMYDQAKR
jgi:hypothetical protein